MCISTVTEYLGLLFSIEQCLFESQTGLLILFDLVIAKFTVCIKVIVFHILLLLVCVFDLSGSQLTLEIHFWYYIMFYYYHISLYHESFLKKKWHLTLIESKYYILAAVHCSPLDCLNTNHCCLFVWINNKEIETIKSNKPHLSSLLSFILTEMKILLWPT